MGRRCSGVSHTWLARRIKSRLRGHCPSKSIDGVRLRSVSSRAPAQSRTTRNHLLAPPLFGRPAILRCVMKRAFPSGRECTTSRLTSPPWGNRLIFLCDAPRSAYVSRPNVRQVRTRANDSLELVRRVGQPSPMWTAPTIIPPDVVQHCPVNHRTLR